MTNDIANLAVKLIWFSEDGSDGYVLRGNPLTIAGSPPDVGIYSYQTNGLNTIDCDIAFQTTPSERSSLHSIRVAR